MSADLYNRFVAYLAHLQDAEVDPVVHTQAFRCIFDHLANRAYPPTDDIEAASRSVHEVLAEFQSVVSWLHDQFHGAEGTYMLGQIMRGELGNSRR